MLTCCRNCMAHYFYGAQANYLINGMHELGHGSVFKTKILNDIFMRADLFPRLAAPRHVLFFSLAAPSLYTKRAV